jgi:hypothetical protein
VGTGCGTDCTVEAHLVDDNIHCGTVSVRRVPFHLDERSRHGLRVLPGNGSHAALLPGTNSSIPALYWSWNLSLAMKLASSAALALKGSPF